MAAIIACYYLYTQGWIPVGNGGLEISGGFDLPLGAGSMNGNAYARLESQEGDPVLTLAPSAQANIDGKVFSGATITLDGFHCVFVGERPLLLFAGSGGRSQMSAIDTAAWYIYSPDEDAKHGPGSLEQIFSEIASWESGAVGSSVIFPSGAEKGFYADQLANAIGARLWPHIYQPDAIEGNQFTGGGASDSPIFNSSPAIETVLEDSGDYLCPVCWLHFDQGDVMHIACHGTLRGDAMLGEEHMQRFHASRFSDRGQALDAMGHPCPDVACPHCRRKLPPGFFDSPHHIFSVVGAPSSGKSYYLSILVKQLQSSLFRNFSLVFRDADPSGNAMLNQMKSKLFSASTPQDAALVKTQLEGEMYEILPRMGRKVALPKPFIFQISRAKNDGQRFSMVFYDNAGEHFEPNRNSHDSPGAQHIASAQAIFFLFDPLHNASFRAKLDGGDDPQLENHEQRRLGSDQQDVILTESDVRIKQLLGMDTRSTLSTPLAFMVGKYDAWRHLPEAKFTDPLAEGCLSLKAIEKNSELLRDILIDIDPAVVANAEAISSNVCYFPISPLGAPPVKFEDENGQEKIGPDPTKIAPIMVEIPTLWALSQIEPSFVTAE